MPAMIDIYSELPLGEARGDLEDDLDEALGEIMQVTGGGGGDRGWNIDLELREGVNVDDAASRIAIFLRAWPVPADTFMNIFPPDWAPGQEPRRMDVFTRE